jgi:hypothetical protein
MRFIKLSLFPLVLLLSFAALLSAADTVGTVQFSESDLTFSAKSGFDVVGMTETDSALIAGYPSLPCKRIHVALPDGATVTGLSVTPAGFVELDGTYNVIPAARVRRISNPAQSDPFIKNPAVYGKNASFPGLWVRQESEWELVGQQFVTLELFPVQYNPVTGKIVLATSISYDVSYTVDPLFERKTYNFSKAVKAGYENRLKGMAVNPGAVAPLPSFSGSSTRALPPGDFEYVIITSSSYESNFQPLADHYTKIGIPTTIKTTTWVTSNYGSGYSGIQSFVDEAHSTWGSIYFLMGGDKNIVSYHTRSISGDNIPNDTYYADYDNDYKVEVYLGRAPVQSSTEATAFVNKVLDYMTTPPTGFGEEVFQMGFDLDSSTDGEDLMVTIKNSYVPAGADYDKEYDSEGGTHKTDARNYINSGHSVSNHCDHCFHDTLGVGSYNHGSHFGNSDASGFSNGSRAGIFYTLGCWPGAFDYSDCWGEYFVRNTGGGGVGFVGNTRYGWYSPGSTNSYSCIYDKNFFRRLWSSNNYRAGVALGQSKNISSTSNTTYKYIFTELTLLGDPAMPIWTAVPGTLTSTHDSSISTGSQSFDVNVKNGGSNLYGALVCVYKGTEVYDRNTTNSSGNVSFSINPSTTGTMYVTVSAENMKPVTGSVSVTGGGSSNFTIDLTLNKTMYGRGETIIYDLDVTNNSSSSETTNVWTNITLPNSNVYPSSGYLDGPFFLSFSANEHKAGTLNLKIPSVAPLANFTFNAFVGPDPGIDDEDHVTFTIFY